ncbi:hypothetical protein CUR178_02368 [Leishmania enriettii]|uniref:Uncharacterized protein n=1 Tax=Leishmania enriettii TaxID=5663 RepID=A0A836GA42_LEIEN|nr:hypothetical protein CUR178_02368 [Leishmania enriettii]
MHFSREPHGYSSSYVVTNLVMHSPGSCRRRVDAAHTIDMPQTATQLPPPLQPEQSSSDTAAASALMSGATTPAAASVISSAQGLAHYFQGLAAGDEMAELIRGLRSSMWRCYQDCLQPPTGAQKSASSGLEGEDATHAQVSAESSDKLSSCIDDTLSRGSSFADAGTRLASPASQIEGAVAATLVAVPETPAPIPPGRLNAAERRQYWVATKAAMLFAVESPSVAEEATALHCSAVTRSILYNYYYPSEGGGGASSSPRVSTMLGAASPVMSTLQCGEVRWILSDARVVELARKELKVDRCDGGVSGWQRALALLRQVDPTPLTSAVELEVYRRTNGHHWAEALGCLWRIEPAQWTEMDVAAAVHCLYSAARRHGQERSVSLRAEEASQAATVRDEIGWRAPSSVFQARLAAQALRIHQAVETAGVLRWSTTSTFNDTLGLIAFDTARWQDACALLDKLLAGARFRVTGATDGAAREAADANRIEKAVSSVHCIRNAAVVAEGDRFPRWPLYGSRVTSQSSDRSVGAHSPQQATPPESLYHLARANVVTLHQTCRAFRSRWDVGLRYVQLLQDAFVDTLNIPSDTAATEDVLCLCIAGQQWEPALRLVTSHQAALMDDAKGERLPSAMHNKSCVSAASKSPATAAVAMPKRAILPQHRQHYRPDVFVQLVRLLGSAPVSRGAAYDLVRRYAAYRAASSTAAAHVFRSSDPTAGLELSKHYNTNTLSRAYNFLVQNADTLDAAEQVLAQLRHSRLLPLEGCSAVACDEKRCAGGDAGGPNNGMNAELAGLETESVAHIAYLSAVAGDWCRALHHTNALLHEPRYRTTFFPTARLHDAVQYALEQAPSPGPSWQVSLQLFTEMTERSVPTSEVSFQCAVKRCFAGGVPGQAQKLFHFALRRGVRP